MFGWLFGGGKKPDKALQGFIRALQDNAEPAVLGDRMQRLDQSLRNADEDEMNDVLTQLAEVAMDAELIHAGAAALLFCGMLVERGADPELMREVAFKRGREAYLVCAKWQRKVQQAIDEAQEGGEEMNDRKAQKIVERVLRDQPQEEADLHGRLGDIACAMLAVLMRLPNARAEIRDDEKFMRAVREFANYQGQPQGGVSRLLDMLEDEELLVLHPASKQGFRVKINGITHNFQLHILLADALIGDESEGWLPGKRPNKRVVAACMDEPWTDDTPIAQASFHMQDFTAVRPNGSIDTNPTEHVIWHEGSPADIPMVEGKRIVILSKVTLPRTWKAPRDFEEIPGEVEVVGRLKPEAVERWLEKCAVAVQGGE
jgi:hypothetical protein